MELVRTATAAGVTTLTLDSPANRNALSTALMRQLLDGAGRRAGRPGRPGRGALPHRPGLLLRRRPEGDRRGPARTAACPAEMLADVLAAIWESPKPVVARVAGPARAGGLGLIAAADIAVCTPEATFAFSEVRLGVIPAVITATVLPRLAPRAAAELYLTGDVFDGRRAAEIGLVTAAVPAEELDAAVAGVLRRPGAGRAAAPWPAPRSCCAGRRRRRPRRAGRADARCRPGTSGRPRGARASRRSAEKRPGELGAASDRRVAGAR